MVDRNTVCFPRWGTQDVTKHGDGDFQKELDRWYSAEESKALEALIDLKARLRTTPTDEFWSVAVEGLSKVVGSEFAFVMKRMLVDDQNTAVEMPPIGEPGSCLMAAALHYTTSNGDKHTVKQNKFHAYACPCAYMRHDKIFLIPEDLDGFITNNPNQLPIAADAYMAIPIFAEGKCIAHFGVMWTKKSSPNRRFSWAFVESLMHSLEDLIGQRIVEGVTFLDSQSKPSEAAAAEATAPPQQRVIPHDAISVAQSLRPYAGSLSHELRTPMQGVVGMLDVMYATVQEAVQSQDDPHLRRVFQNLKDSIEVVQDSSRRAVVAADNVVHAYDMNMSVPEAISPLQDISDPMVSIKQPEIVVAGQEIPLARSTLKRRRATDAQEPQSPSNKMARIEAAASAWVDGTEPSQEIKAGLQEAENVHAEDRDLRQAAKNSRLPHTPEPNEPRKSPGLQPACIVRRAANIRAVLQYVINEGLKTGGRPDFVNSIPTNNGEMIEVRSRGSDGTVSQKHIEWSVADELPTTLNYDEKDFSKLVSCVVLNAIKFTNSNDGCIKVDAGLAHNGRYLSIKITDNGPGIPVDFLPKLFKAFSQENGSITRQSDGLGLGLMVAKGISRKLGGDLMCIRTETDLASHGSEFEIKLPMTPGDAISRSSSPAGTPPLQKQELHHSPQPRRLSSPPRTDGACELRRDSSDVARAEVVSNLDHINSIPNGQTTPAEQKRPVLNKLHRSNGLLRTASNFEIDRELATKFPLRVLVAEDNKINRKLLVSMLSKFGYRDVLEAHDGAEAVRQMATQLANGSSVDIILMDLWMPTMDGYEATARILKMDWTGGITGPTVLAVTADVTDGALERAAQVGMKGFMTKPYKLQDLQRLITEFCLGRAIDDDDGDNDNDDNVKDNAINDRPTVLSQTAIAA
ncbi:hypothetical protein AMS68_005780 [Peltaster fructicola]|uniref:histidine kinase n=1 Tax=Peltaster fructicola TaxID=286661 RepID=A0A6H0XZS5_9PEZI|nr:hypothetical protein AMS68_005780 [Peltaster fructicola]